jgi:hypothetical protein
MQQSRCLRSQLGPWWILEPAVCLGWRQQTSWELLTAHPSLRPKLHLGLLVRNLQFWRILSSISVSLVAAGFLEKSLVGGDKCRCAVVGTYIHTYICGEGAGLKYI